MKSFILNEIYSVFLFYDFVFKLLICYIIKYVVRINGEWGGYVENPFDRESPSLAPLLFMRGWGWFWR